MSPHHHGSDGRGVREILEDVSSGALPVSEALDLLPLLQIAQLEQFARLDVGRAVRKGVPEVVYAPGKTDMALEAIVRAFLTEGGLALVSRLAPPRADLLRAALDGENCTISYDPSSGVFEAVAPGYEPPRGVGTVGVLTAGTSDIGVAEEAALVARHMGCGVLQAYDVGVAGIHRLLEPLTQMLRARVAAFVVVAGMEGALPSLVAGLVDVPVIGVPKSGGYGVGGDGTAALHSMLQSCSPGLVVVNVDNGIGAGATAALIARRGATEA